MEINKRLLLTLSILSSAIEYKEMQDIISDRRKSASNYLYKIQIHKQN